MLLFIWNAGWVQYCYHCHGVYCKLNQVLFLECTYIVKLKKKKRYGWLCYYFLNKLSSENVRNRPEQNIT